MPSIQNQDYQALELPYKHKSTSMALILPAVPGKEALRAVEQNISHPCKELLNARHKTATLTMPQFKITSDHQLAETLSSLGIGNIFGSDPDLSGICREEGIHIGQILHSMYIDVNRHGTEAAAVTTASVVGADMEEEWVNLTIDRPFLFMVVEKKSGVILFMGKVEKLKSQSAEYTNQETLPDDEILKLLQ